MSKPLAGVRVLDLTNVLAGPFAAYQLSLLGAEVIKIESPQGDLARELGASPQAAANKMGLSYSAQNAGKQSIVLDLKTAPGRQVFFDLLDTARVVIENFRPGVMDRLQLGFDVLKQRNPQLVYCAISGFGQTGDLASTPAYDQIIQGYSGVMSITGHPEGPATRAGFPVADTVGGLTAAMAICAALNRTDQAQLIDVSMLESLMSTLGWAASNQLQAGVSATRLGNENMTSAPSGAFETADGLLNVAANQEAHWQRLCVALDCQDLLQDGRFQTRDLRKQHRAELNQVLAPIFKRQATQHWVAHLSRANIPVGPVLSLEESLQQEQVIGRGFIDPDHRLVTNGFLLNGQRLRPNSPPPTLDQDRLKILRDLGYTDAQIEALHE